MPKIYLIGSLRNPAVPEIGNDLRTAGFDVFDDWYAAGPEADDCWREYETLRGHSFEQALEGYSAKHVYNFDLTHLHEADAGILLTPAGKSGHLELGFLAGRGKKTMVYFTDPNPDRWDVMYQFVDLVVFSKEKMLETLGVWFKQRTTITTSVPQAFMCESWKHVYPTGVKEGEPCHCGAWNFGRLPPGRLQPRPVQGPPKLGPMYSA